MDWQWLNLCDFGCFGFTADLESQLSGPSLSLRHRARNRQDRWERVVRKSLAVAVQYLPGSKLTLQKA